MPKLKPNDKTKGQVQEKHGPSGQNEGTESPQRAPGPPSPLFFDEMPPMHEVLGFVNSDQIRAQLNGASIEQIEEVLFSALGKGPHPNLTQWAEHRLDLLGPYNITQELTRLEELGIKKESLAVSLMAINLSPGFDYCFGKLFGNKKTRQKHAAALIAPIPTLKILLDSMGNLSNDLKSTSFATPARVISDLKFFSFFFVLGDKLYEFLGVNSMLELSKFGLASLVHNTAGNYLDREVSALTGAALQKEDYDETGHRVWRIRNFRRLQKSIPFLTKLFVAFNNAISRS